MGAGDDDLLRLQPSYAYGLLPRHNLTRTRYRIGGQLHFISWLRVIAWPTLLRVHHFGHYGHLSWDVYKVVEVSCELVDGRVVHPCLL